MVARGKRAYTETVVEGFDQIPQAFIDLDGKNKGKMVVKCNDNLENRWQKQL
jgi:NADPH-dependent curcumin reductase CurA